MFRRFGTPFAADWITKNVNGYLYTAAIPADPDWPADAMEYGARYGARVPARRRVRQRIGKYLDATLPVYGEQFVDWWRDRLVPEMERNFAFLEEELDRQDQMSPAGSRRPARGRDRHPRSPLEDPLDAQLRPAVGDAQSAGGDGEDARPRRRRTAGPPPELGQRPQLGLDPRAVGDEAGGQGGRSWLSLQPRTAAEIIAG